MVKCDHIITDLTCLHRLPVMSWVMFKALVLTYKAVYSLWSHCLGEHLSTRSPTWASRSAQVMVPQVAVPKEARKTSRSGAFSVMEPTLWSWLLNLCLTPLCLPLRLLNTKHFRGIWRQPCTTCFYHCPAILLWSAILGICAWNVYPTLFCFTALICLWWLDF